jgi:hypothetical protein
MPRFVIGVGEMVLSSRDYLVKALQAFRIADDMPRADDRRELRHIAEQYLALAQDALAEEEQAREKATEPTGACA